jgi:hypothetical protein
MEGTDLSPRAGRGPVAGWRSALILAACAVTLVAGCSGRPQVQRSLQYDAIDLKIGDLEQYGMAFITPSSYTGQEQDRESVAFLFARVLQEQRPGIPVTTLAETLGAINRAGLAQEYKGMFEFYEDTGMLPAQTLGKIGKLTGRRYVAVLKLASFEKRNRSRLSVVGIRFIDTKVANLRLYYQLWDSDDGSIAWEANQELTMAYESVKETFITFDMMVETIAQDLVSRLPRHCSEAEIGTGDCVLPAEGQDDGYRVGGVTRSEGTL